MEFKNLSTSEQMRCIKREEFYKEHMSIAKFHETFDSVRPEMSDLTFYEKYKYLEDKTEVTPEVWGAAKLIPMSDGEAWVDFNYSVSTHGRVWSHKTDKQITLKTYPDKYKYCFIDKKYASTQRLVLSTFGFDILDNNPKSKLTVNHIDKVRDNNFLLNLEWMTFTENKKDAELPSPAIKITVMHERVGLPIGKSWYLKKRSDVKHYSISPRTFKQRLRNSIAPYGLLVEKVELSEIVDPGLTDDIVAYLKQKFT